MSIKYIQETKDGIWKVSSTKRGVSLRNFYSEKDAISYATSVKVTTSIFVKRNGQWVQTLNQEAEPKVNSTTSTKITSKKAKTVVTKKPMSKNQLEPKPIKTKTDKKEQTVMIEIEPKKTLKETKKPQEGFSNKIISSIKEVVKLPKEETQKDGSKNLKVFYISIACLILILVFAGIFTAAWYLVN